MKVKRDQLTGAVLVIAGLFFAYLISQFKTPFTPQYPGPSLLPGIGAFGLIVCGAGIFVQGCLKKDEDSLPRKDGFGFLSALWLSAFMCWP